MSIKPPLLMRTRTIHGGSDLSERPGRVVTRRVLPAAITVLAILGLLRWLGERQGLYGTAAGMVMSVEVV